MGNSNSVAGQFDDAWVALRNLEVVERLFDFLSRIDDFGAPHKIKTCRYRHKIQIKSDQSDG